jgi:hypothetical protein
MDLEKSLMGEMMKQMKGVKLADHGVFCELSMDESLLGLAVVVAIVTGEGCVVR